MMPINFLAVIVASIVCFMFGWLWYGPLFGKIWAREKKMSGDGKMPPIKLLYQFITVLTTVIALFVLSTGTLAYDLFLIFILWFGFLVANSMSNMIWDSGSWTLFLIDILYHLARFALIVLVFSFF